MKLFEKDNVFDSMSALVRQTEEGGATDSRAATARQLIAAGAERQAVYDELCGFVSDPAIFAAAVSGIAGASLPPATIESLLAVTSVKALRKLAKDFDEATIETNDADLRAFLDEAARVNPDGRAWTMLVAGHLSLLRANREIRPLIYPFNQPK